MTLNSAPTLRSRVEYVCHPIPFWIPSFSVVGCMYLRRIICPQHGLRPRRGLLAKTLSSALWYADFPSISLESRREVDCSSQLRVDHVQSCLSTLHATQQVLLLFTSAPLLHRRIVLRRLRRRRH